MDRCDNHTQLPSVRDRDIRTLRAEDGPPHQQDAVARTSALGDELIAADWPDPES